VVGLVIVSHSPALAAGVVELAREMGGPEVAIEAAGGLEDGAIGTDAELVRAARGAWDEAAFARFEASGGRLVSAFVRARKPAEA
jgi:dihydroxyacetone kinase DhaKLM complex PTS-EIIA-like component DhaM